jgi:hypothetical protein
LIGHLYENNLNAPKAKAPIPAIIITIFKELPPFSSSEFLFFFIFQ